eukprot:1153664-Pelagomonas_calceolata.AAC.2
MVRLIGEDMQGIVEGDLRLFEPIYPVVAMYHRTYSSCTGAFVMEECWACASGKREEESLGAQEHGWQPYRPPIRTKQKTILSDYVGNENTPSPHSNKGKGVTLVQIPYDHPTTKCRLREYSRQREKTGPASRKRAG